MVELLLQEKYIARGVRPAADNNAAIRWAVRNGHTEVVELLLHEKYIARGVDPAAEHNEAIRWAAKKGHTEIASILENFQASALSSAK